MGLVVLLVLVIGIGVLIATFRRSGAGAYAPTPSGGRTTPYGNGRGTLFGGGATSYSRTAALDQADAEAEARHWVERLGAGILALDGHGNASATQALADAAERHNAAGAQLATARSAVQFALAGRTAIEGLHYIRAARVALGMDPGPSVPEPSDGLGPQRPLLSAQQPIVIGGQQYMGAPQPGAATPYYYGGGMYGGQQVPAGWYSTPWWKTALVAGAASMAGTFLIDELMEGGRGFGGGFGHHHHHGGFGGGFGGHHHHR